MASLTGFDQKAVLMGEAGIILKTCAVRTRAPTLAKTDLRSWVAILGGLGLTKGANEGDIAVNAGVRGPFGRVWVRTRGGAFTAATKRWSKSGPGRFRLAGQISPDGQTFRPYNYHWSNGTWSDIQKTVSDVANKSRSKLPKGRAAAGLARQSWIQIADSLGIDVGSVQGGGSLSAAAVAKARAAIATTGKPNQNGTSISLGDDEKAAITLINRLPYGSAIGFDRTLLTVIAGRAGYFKKSYENGAFDTMAKAAAAFPWLRVTRIG